MCIEYKKSKKWDIYIMEVKNHGLGKIQLLWKVSRKSPKRSTIFNGQKQNKSDIYLFDCNAIQVDNVDTAFNWYNKFLL